MSEIVLHDVSRRDDGGGKDRGSRSNGMLSIFSLGCFCKGCQRASDDETEMLTKFIT